MENSHKRKWTSHENDKNSPLDFIWCIKTYQSEVVFPHKDVHIEKVLQATHSSVTLSTNFNGMESTDTFFWNKYAKAFQTNTYIWSSSGRLSIYLSENNHLIRKRNLLVNVLVEKTKSQLNPIVITTPLRRFFTHPLFDPNMFHKNLLPYFIGK